MLDLGLSTCCIAALVPSLSTSIEISFFRTAVGADCANVHVLAVLFLHTSRGLASRTKQSSLAGYHIVCYFSFRDLFLKYVQVFT